MTFSFLAWRELGEAAVKVFEERERGTTWHKTHSARRGRTRRTRSSEFLSQAIGKETSIKTREIEEDTKATRALLSGDVDGVPP